MRRNLSTSGLSLSQAQSISNLCNQRALDISSSLTSINNGSKSFTYNGEKLLQTPGKRLPSNVVELLMEKSKLHACQAFLMEHIKLKDKLIKNVQKEFFTHDLPGIEPLETKTVKLADNVDEAWGWDQLTNGDKNEFLEAEAYAAHIGQFIHKNGVLDVLRTELPKIQTLEFIELEKDKKIPLIVNIHHTPEELLSVHEALATEHRKYEQKVNYYKAKVKNLVTSENARISKENGELQANVNAENDLLFAEWEKKHNVYTGEVKRLHHIFEQNRQDQIKEISGLKIAIDPRFQDVVDMFLTQVISE
jgi:hypothetical protein